MQRLGYFYLFLFISGIIAQRSNWNKRTDDGERDDEDESPSKINNQPQQQKQPVRSGASPSTQLSTAKDCEADVRKYCAKGSQQPLSNLKVLQCVDELDNAANLFTPECQHVIYEFKVKMTHDPRFDDAAQRQCSKDLKILDQCADHNDERGSGRLITCLYEHLNNITEPSCRYFINQLQAVVFNDWRLTEYFVDSCKSDITKFECGRFDDNNQKLTHEQGAVVSCLSQQYRDLTSDCRKEIFRLAEMQSDDYHLDRALYYACRDDRERLCGQVAAGNGRVYRCLYEQKFNTMMSAPCRKEVHRRQQLVVANIQADIPLVRACNAEMKEHQCSIDINDSDKRSSLVRLLLCLEERLKKGYHIQDECRREMLVHRRMLMSDYELSPELASECKTEMIRFCPSLFQQGASSTIDQRGGRMIHCLLGAARKGQEFSANCLSIVRSLVRAVDPGNDIRADPLLESTCRTAIDKLCPSIKPGDSSIIMCLLDNLKSSHMNEECEDRLMEIAYFMARDWRLTPKLMRTCQNDLKTYCHLPSDWSMKDDLSDNQVGMYLGCLYQQRQQIDNECRSEVRRLMHIRSQSVGLMPEIELNCITDLATCVKTDVKGEEMKCLQKNYNRLEEKCKAAVRNHTQLAMADPSLDFLLMKACEPMIQTFCSNIDNGKENDLIRCLIAHKNEQSMDFRCKAGIEHHQITSMKDEAFLSNSFRQQCAAEVNEHCLGKKTKSAVIQCLADLMLQDILRKQNSLRDGCREELKFELLQRSESIDFDPALARACRNDIRKLCADLAPGNAQILDCLKENNAKVSTRCYAKLRKREKLDIIMPENDYSLMSKCGYAIQKFCTNENKQNILACLRRNANQATMPNACRRVLYHRLMILNSDARFNKGLIESCGTDITQHCHKEIVDIDDTEADNDDDEDNDKDSDEEPTGRQNIDETQDREMGGRVIQCLRMKYTETKATLSSQCISELVEVIQSSKLDIKLDIRLYHACRSFIDTECTAMDQEDCLKLKYQKGAISDSDCADQIKRIILEGKADIHVDRALAFACQADLLKYCNDIPIGSGKQLQCLINIQKSVTQQCQKVLNQRKDLWKTISQVDDISEVVETIRKSEHSGYLLSVILIIACVLFIAGCVCRPYMRYNRVRKYK